MAPGESQEGFFWDTHPWVMSAESGSEEKSAGVKNQLVDSSIDNNKSQMKQREMGSTGGSNGGAQETIATVIGDGGLKNGDAFKTEDVDDKKVNNQGNKRKGGVDPTEHELHIWTERERRKKMRNMFHQLHALLPQLSPKADKSTIVDEAVNHIKTLQQTLQKLQRKKRERFHGLSTNTTINASIIQPQGLILNTRESFLADQVSPNNHFGMVSPAPSSTSFSFPIRSPTVFQTWTSSNVTLNVCGLDAHFSICSPRKRGLVTTICFVLEKHKLDIVSAHISSDQKKIFFMIHAHANTHNQFVESFPYDEVYKQAAAEIMLWVTSKSS
ncbi:unnamed protein product [Lactuca saligna]|uniref:BHLH domain-containing protein n=1 Tax=Lactuca saligna TaxID=75948 RepID=A0AA36A542_LACSI|nr:unnamed protein product [Lactuca saligna]